MTTTPTFTILPDLDDLLAVSETVQLEAVGAMQERATDLLDAYKADGTGALRAGLVNIDEEALRQAMFGYAAVVISREAYVREIGRHIAYQTGVREVVRNQKGLGNLSSLEYTLLSDAAQDKQALILMAADIMLFKSGMGPLKFSKENGFH